VPTLHILNAGYVGERVASTVALVETTDALVVIDPGMVASTSLILDPLAELHHRPEDVTDVIISHHHPDHTMNIALFPNARVHDHWAIYRHDLWASRRAEGFEVASGITLWETPGHTPQDITTIVETPDGLVALTHLWWHQDGPLVDRHATDPDGLTAGRQRVLGVADLIVPGHGDPFRPADWRATIIAVEAPPI
jgi:glyoxylase-like metal-dependent hydrolase (beta-lactamase superfamily II)